MIKQVISLIRMKCLFHATNIQFLMKIDIITAKIVWLAQFFIEIYYFAINLMFTLLDFTIDWYY